MSILITGIEMPKSCRKCMISQPDGCGWICPIIEIKPIVDGRVNSRPQHCPLVPVPPHGRLIDADALKDIEFHGLQADKKISYQMGWNDAIATIAENATTIIPAEEA